MRITFPNLNLFSIYGSLYSIKASRVRRTSTSRNSPYYDKVSHSFVRGARSYDLGGERILLTTRKEVSEWSASVFPGRSCDSHGRHATKSRTIGESQIGSRSRPAVKKNVRISCDLLIGKRRHRQRFRNM